MSTQRVALYWTPELSDPLTQAGNAWLGRDAELATEVPQPPIAGLPEVTAAPRLYGFHATLRPPMRLATGWEEFIQAAYAVAEAIPPFDLPRLQVAGVDGYLALQEAARSPLLQGRMPPNWRAAAQLAFQRPRTRCWCAGATPTSYRSGAFT